MLVRQHYLQWLINAKDNEFVKVITGVRRSGKSVLLQLYQEYLLSQGVSPANIIFYNFEHPQNFKFAEAETLYAQLEQQVQGVKGKIYFIFDEIQEVNGWQKLVNGLRVAFDADIYITGSNANLLSGELATYLAGRYIELTVYPFSFKEFVDYQQSKGRQDYPDKLFQEYLVWGGFPSLMDISDETIRRDILQGVYDSIVLKDVATRGAVRDIAALRRVVVYLLDTIGSSTSIKRVTDMLNSERLKITVSSVDKYVQLLKDSFVFYEALRYDIRGRAYLQTQGRYYVIDTGIRNAVLGQVGSVGSQLENIIYIELKRRGYDVFVGKLDSEEIDFVCFKGDDRQYIQVAYQLPLDNPREQKNLLHINDNYKKTILTLNRIDVGSKEGIQVVHAVDWLLSE